MFTVKGLMMIIMGTIFVRKNQGKGFVLTAGLMINLFMGLMMRIVIKHSVTTAQKTANV
jgi:hypothetical protein